MIDETKRNQPSILYPIEDNVGLMYIFWMELYCLVIRNVQARRNMSFGGSGCLVIR